MNDLLPYRTEIAALLQAAINAELLQEPFEILQTLETLQRSYQGQGPEVLPIVIFLIRSRGVM